jgi:hypothetical protein
VHSSAAAPPLQFCKVILKHKAAAAGKEGAEADTLDAFVALGGNPDRSGKVSSDKLRATIKVRRRALGWAQGGCARLPALGACMASRGTSRRRGAGLTPRHALAMHHHAPGV